MFIFNCPMASIIKRYNDRIGNLVETNNYKFELNKETSNTITKLQFKNKLLSAQISEINEMKTFLVKENKYLRNNKSELQTERDQLVNYLIQQDTMKNKHSVTNSNYK
jgi:hypothetical protein